MSAAFLITAAAITAGGILVLIAISIASVEIQEISSERREKKETKAAKSKLRAKVIKL